NLQHLVPAPRLVQAERRTVFELRERVLELVAVMEDLRGREDLLERRLGEPADAAECVPHLTVLRLDLRLVGEILEPAAAASRVVLAGSFNAQRPRMQHLGDERLAVPPPP